MDLFAPGSGVVANMLFWMWIVNINLAFVNVLPVMFLDGGHVIGLVSESISASGEGKMVSSLSVTASTAVTVCVFCIAILIQ